MTNRLKSIWVSYKRKREQTSIGLIIRNKIHHVSSVVHPYAKIILPNFRAVHYFYIIFMTFLGSILMYPVKNYSYIDILFTTAGCATQAGLNTINFNQTTLYQQIIMYIITTLSTPIIIHGSLLFIRLYWFERHFDDIKESSKLNFKMRRNATLAARTQSLDSTRANTNRNQGLGFNPKFLSRSNTTSRVYDPPAPNNNQLDEYNSSSLTSSLKNDNSDPHNSSPQSSSTIPNNHNNNNHPENKPISHDQDVLHLSEPSDTEDQHPSRSRRNGNHQSSSSLTNAATGVDPIRSMPSPTNDSEGIRFGDLPHPSKKKQQPRKKEIDPSDMYMSIAMLRNNHNNKNSGARSPNGYSNGNGTSNGAGSHTIPIVRTPSGNYKHEPSRSPSPHDDHDNNNSINSNHNTNNGDDDDEILVIKPPNEIEKDIHNPIYTKKSRRKKPTAIHFDEPSKTKKKGAGNSNATRRLKKVDPKKKWSRLRKTFSNSSPGSHQYHHHNRHNRTVSMNSMGDDEIEDDDASIDSENRDIDNITTDVNDDDDDDGAEADDENAIEDDTDLDGDAPNRSVQIHSDYDDDADLDDDEHHIQRAQSNLALPSSDATGGKKFSKRSNTLEVPPGRRNSFMKSPTFERIVRGRGKKTRSTPLRKLRTPSFYKISSSRSHGDGTSRTNVENDDDFSESNLSSEDSEEDDEEDYNPTADNSLSKVMSTNYLSWVPTVGRNSTFVHLTEEQKEELGGVEYRAVKLLIKILLFYYIGFHVLAAIVLIIYINCKPNYAAIVKAAGVSPTWWGFFEGQSSFNDLGFTLTPDSMQSFNKSVYVMIWVSFFVVIGNTGFPVLLRFLIWALFEVAKPLSLFKESLGFLLDHPRRCFTLLFPSVPTWWLFSILVILNAVDLILFIILDLHSDYLSSIPVGYRVMDGLFQAFSTRTAGFAVVDLSQLHPAVQVSYMLMMYISVLPLAISIRRTNVYEEQSLGLYLKEQNDNEDMEKSPKTFIGTHLRNQLSFDLWFIFLGLFIICIAEGGKLDNDNFRFSVFSILFEIISAYGTVGLSLGYPNVDQSLSYKFTTISKLVIIAMMIRGRHRGLPYSLDRAIMLPDDNMHRRDRVQENHAIRRNATIERSATNATESSGNNLRRALSRRASTIPGLDSVLSKRRPTSFSGAPSEHTRNYAESRNAESRNYAESRNAESRNYAESGLSSPKAQTPHYQLRRAEDDEEDIEHIEMELRNSEAAHEQLPHNPPSRS